MTTGSEPAVSPRAEQSPRLTIIGSLAGPGAVSRAADLNDRGDVVGTTALPGTETTHAFLMNPETDGGALIDLTPSEERSSQAEAINRAGVVVGGLGASADGSRPMEAFVWEVRTGPAVLPLPPGAASAVAVDVNDRGTILVVGMTDVPDPAAPGMNVPVGSFLWDPADRAYTPLPLLDPSAVGPLTLARTLDEHGGVIGGVVTQLDERSWHHAAVVWEPGTLTPHELSAGGGTDAYATGGNDKGLIVGWRMAVSGGPSIAVYWTAPDAAPVELPGRVAFTANDAGQIVGIRDFAGAATFPFTTVLWEPGRERATDLGDLGLGSYVFAVNAEGRSAGYAVAPGEGEQTHHTAVWWDAPRP
ncbi:putative membrane protein [Catenulispora sp. GAS73]|uniref:hypothetical protein n=1 Tax=Catenulispora sp. GAS73 TaxID=3156269 RepID=UPI003514B278